MSGRFPVERGDGDNRYCPYCNSCPLDDLTDEHVFTQSIGGDGRNVIRVCVRCNSTAGSAADASVSRHSWLRILAFNSGNLMRRQERHESTAFLKDGKGALVGYFYLIESGDGKARPAFDPRRQQPDGSVWISEHACPDPAKLPPHINIYKEDMLEKASVTATPPQGSGLESAMVKILLGMSYWARGKEALMLTGFDAMRESVRGAISPRISVEWIESLEALKCRKLPFEVKLNEHSVWGECADGYTFIGGVSLFGRIIAEIRINDFGSVLPGRCTFTENIWLPN
jgi:hypothetical protein